MESRILGDGYVRFGERTMQTYSSNAERRYFPTLPLEFDHTGLYTEIPELLAQYKCSAEAE